VQRDLHVALPHELVLHSLFENSAAIASGVYYALKHKGLLGKVSVVATGGDGGTADIGLQCLSGAAERGDDFLYVCWDNEAYMNTGVQRSGLTPFNADTTTSPAGKVSFGNDRCKKDMPQIMAAHGIPYVGIGSCGYYRELGGLVKRAMAIRGPKYLQVHSVCPLGWKSDPAKARRAPKDGWKPAEEYLKPQGRFRHLFRAAEGASQIIRIQAVAAANMRKFWPEVAVPQFALDAEAKVAEMDKVTA
jgi:pyruvate ferredoxin oxidoreductase beta subunit